MIEEAFFREWIEAGCGEVGQVWVGLVIAHGGLHNNHGDRGAALEAAQQLSVPELGRLQRARINTPVMLRTSREAYPIAEPASATAEPAIIIERTSMPKHGLYALVGEFVHLAWPAVIRNMLNCAADRATLSFVGHWDESVAHYDGAGLGKMYSNITGLSIGLGLSKGLATLCSQAHGAGRGADRNGLYLRQCALWMCVALLYAIAAAVYAEPILLALAQPAAVAHASARFAQVQLFGVPFFWASFALQTVCDGGCQDTRPGLYSNLASSAAQLVLCVLAVHPKLLNWGYLGMAAARSAGGVLQFGLLVAIIISQKRQALVWRRAQYAGRPLERALTRHGLCTFLAVALPSACILWVEWWSFELQCLIVGLLPNATVLLAAHGTLFNLVAIAYMTFTGLGTALCALTGKYVGKGAAATVPRLCAIAVALALALSLSISGALYGLRRPLGHLFTTDAAVVNAIDENMLGVSLGVPPYAILMTLYGACIGTNQRAWPFAGTLIGYAIGLPLAYYLARVRQWPRPLMGVWLGNAAALGFAALCVIAFVVCKDWKRVRAVSSGGDTRDDRLLSEEEAMAAQAASVQEDPRR